jgi:hypothetical protein
MSGGDVDTAAPRTSMATARECARGVCVWGRLFQAAFLKELKENSKSYRNLELYSNFVICHRECETSERRTPSFLEPMVKRRRT